MTWVPPDESIILKGVRVLVLEDDGDTRELLGIVLESRGASVILSSNLPEALEVVRNQAPDVIVADIGLPEYNGYAFIAALAKKDPTSNAHPSLH